MPLLLPGWTLLHCAQHLAKGINWVLGMDLQLVQSLICPRGFEDGISVALLLGLGRSPSSIESVKGDLVNCHIIEADREIHSCSVVSPHSPWKFTFSANPPTRTWTSSLWRKTVAIYRLGFHGKEEPRKPQRPQPCTISHGGLPKGAGRVHVVDGCRSRDSCPPLRNASFLRCPLITTSADKPLTPSQGVPGDKALTRWYLPQILKIRPLVIHSYQNRPAAF